jgi:hypothetical protein
VTEEQETNHETSAAANSLPPPATPPEITPPTGPPATEQQLENAETDIERRMTGFERSTLRWSKAMVVVTTGTALFICFQWLEMHDAGKQTDRIIVADERIAKAMEDSVKKSGDALNASIEASRTDQRAWVGVKSINVGTLEAEKNLVAEVALNNSGKSLANKVQGYATLAISDSRTLREFPEPPREPVESVAIYWPGIDLLSQSPGLKTFPLNAAFFLFTEPTTTLTYSTAPIRLVFAQGTRPTQSFLSSVPTTIMQTRASDVSTASSAGLQAAAENREQRFQNPAAGFSEQGEQHDLHKQHVENHEFKESQTAAEQSRAATAGVEFAFGIDQLASRPHARMS